MALVKKFQNPPGPVVDEFDNLLNAELSKFNIKGKHEPKVRQALAGIRDYVKANPDSFTTDEVLRKYTISGTNKFKGSPDEINSNWFSGKLKLEDDADINSLAALIYDNARKQYQSKQTTTDSTKTPLTDVTIQGLTDHIVGKYPSPEIFEREWGALKNVEEAKTKIKDYAKALVNSYVSGSNDGKYNYVDLDKAKAFKEAIDKADIKWEDLKTAGFKLNWDLDALLPSVEANQEALRQRQEADTKAAAEQAEAERLAGIRNSYIRIGVPADFVDVLLDSGYTEQVFDPEVYNKDKDVSKKFKMYMDEYGWKMFKNPTTGTKMLYDRNYNPVTFENKEASEFDDLFGLRWNHKTGSLNFENWEGKRRERGNVGLGLLGNIEGYKDWEITGWPSKDSTPGKRDYTHTLVLTKGKDKITLTKGADGKYKTSNGEVFNAPIKIIGYDHKRTDVVDKPIDYNVAFPGINAVPLSNNYNYKSDVQLIRAVLQSGKVGTAAKEAAGRLKEALTKDPNLLNGEDGAIVRQLLGDFQSIQYNKQGGILKLQEGSFIKNYFAQQGKTKSQPAEKPKVYKDITGSWADLNTEQKIAKGVSTAGAVASFIPGVGAIGATTTLLADIYSDIRDGDGKTDWLNHGLNLGFVALSAVGLGGVRALLKAGKAAKTLSTAKGLGKALRYEKALGVSAKEMKALQALDESAKALKAETFEELVTKVGRLEKMTPSGKNIANFNAKLEKHKKAIKEGESVLKEILETKAPLTKSQLVNNAISLGAAATKPFTKALTKSLVGQTLKGAMAIPGLVSAGNVYNTVKEDGWQYVNPDDVKNVVFSAGSVRSLYKDLAGVRALKRQNIGTTGKNETKFKIGDEEITIDRVLEKPALKKSYIRKDATNVTNQKKLEDYKQSVIDAAQKQGKTITMDQLKDLTLDDFMVTAKSASKSITLGESRTSTGKGRAIDERDFQLAKKFQGKYDKPSETLGEKVKRVLTKKKKSVPREYKPMSDEGKAKVKELRDNQYDYLKYLKRDLKSSEGKLHNLKLHEKAVKRELQKSLSWKTKKKAFSKKRKPIVLEKRSFDPRNRFTGYNNQQSISKVKTLLERRSNAKSLVNQELSNFDYLNSRTQFYQKEFDDLVKSLQVYKKEKGGILKFQKPISEGIHQANQKQGVWPFLKENMKFDRTDFANALMYANNYVNNTRSGIEQRKAINESVYSTPLISKPYLRIGSDHLLNGYLEMGRMNSAATRLGNATSDIDKSFAIRTNGILKSAELGSQYAKENTAINVDLLRNKFARDAQIDQQNAGIVANNRALSAEARKNIHLVNTNEIVAKDVAFTNLITATNKNRNVKGYEDAVSKYYDLAENKDYKDLIENYTKKSGEVGRVEAFNAYNKAKENIKNTGGIYPETFEESEEYKTWQANVASLMEEIKLKRAPIELAARNVNSARDRMYYKKGGSLTLQERITLEDHKSNSKLSEKSLEQVFKMIIHNNEMLHKALIKVFK